MRLAIARCVALFVIAGLAACSQALVGDQFHTLTRSGGPPANVVELPDRSRVYWWRNATCELAATVDTRGEVIAAEFTGPDCTKLRRRFGVSES